MNGAHLHLLLNHLPILGSLFGFVLLLVALARRQPLLVRAGTLGGQIMHPETRGEAASNAPGR